MSEAYVHVPAPTLGAFVIEVCVAAGATEVDGRTVADHLVTANLYGHDSHGVGMLPKYVDSIASGQLDPKAHAEIRADGAILSIDGRRGFGQVVAREGIAAGIARARSEGLALAALRNAFHIGRIGTYGEQCAAEGLVSLHFVNVVGHPPLVAPFRGSDARFSTNPFCCAIPLGPGKPPFLLDFATSVVAMGKVRVAKNKGEVMDEGLLLDHQGQPTRDPGVMFPEIRGALVAMGLHKGYGLALACELLAGAVAGGRTVQPGTPRGLGIINNMLSIIVDPQRLVPDSFLQSEIQAMIDYAKASPPADPDLPVLVPGEPERERRAERLRTGVPIDLATWDELRGAAHSLGVLLPEVQAAPRVGSAAVARGGA